MSSRSGTSSHTADLGLWVEADSAPELFSAAAVALATLMYAGPRDGRLSWQPFQAQGLDRAELLVQLLAEVVYQADAEGLLLAAAEIGSLSETSLEARLGFIPLQPSLHEPAEPVKAVTYHEAQVSQSGSGWKAHVILDV